MFGDDDGLALVFLEAFEDAVDLDLVADVEMEAGLVEQKYGSVLGQGPGDKSPLPLAARSAGRAFFAHARDVGQPHRLGHGRLVPGRGLLEPPLAGEIGP